MKRLIDIKSLILGGLLGAAIIMTVGAATSERTTAWEYKRMPGVAEGTLNQMAEQGWTVVGYAEYSVANEARTSYLLKRAKP